MGAPLLFCPLCLRCAFRYNPLMLKFNLHKKVLGAFLLLSLLPLVLLLINSHHSLRLVEDLLRQRITASLDTQAAKALELRAEMVARQVSDFLHVIEGDLHDLAALPATEEAFLDFSWRHQQMLWYRRGANEKPIEVRERVLLYSELAYVGADGQEKIRIVEGRPATSLRNVADPKQTTYKNEEYFQQTACLPAGEIWVSRLHGWYVSRDQQLQGADTPLEAVQGTPYRGVIRFATPIWEGTEFKGVVVLSLDHRHLMEFTQHISPTDERYVVFPSYASGNYAFMFDDLGWMIAHPKYWDIRGYDPDGTLVPAYTENTTEEEKRLGRLPFNLLEVAFIHPNYPKAAEAVRRKETGVIDTTNVGGSKKIMAYAPILYDQGVYRKHKIFGGITIGSEVDYFHQPAVATSRLIRQEITNYLRESWLVISMTVLLVVVAAYTLSNSIVRPLLSLTEGTREMIRGNLSARVNVVSADEVGVLTQSFNTMVEELNNRRRRLLKTLQALRRSRHEIIRERNFKDTVFENVETGILTFDHKRQVTSLNGPACKILSVDRPEQDCDWQQLLGQWPELGEVLEEWFSVDVTGSKEPFRRYVPLERAGRPLTYRMAIFPLSFRQQAGWLLTIEDLTERVNMRQQIARMDRLASLGRMSAGIAHEVRNPLTGVSLLLDELHDRLLGKEDDQKLIRRALEEIERLELLVNEMLRFSSISAPQLTLGQVESVVRESLFLIRKQCQRQKVELVERVETDLPEVRIDSDRLKQVLLNLYNNALDAMPEGGIMTVSAEMKEEAIVVSVVDTGQGIPAEQIPLVFEPFYTSKGQGTGLGLSISYNIISDHGGELDVKSRPGEETVFRFTLPLV